MTIHWSGRSYVTVQMKVGSNGERGRIKIVSAKNCDHTSTICPTKSCVESWEFDYVLYFRRTQGGMALARAIGREVDGGDT